MQSDAGIQNRTAMLDRTEGDPKDDGLRARIVDLLAGAEVVTAAATTDECLSRRFRPVDVVITPW